MSVIGPCYRFATAAMAEEVKVFFAANPLPKHERTIAQKIETIETSVKYLDAVKQSSALEWLQQRVA